MKEHPLLAACASWEKKEGTFAAVVTTGLDILKMPPSTLAAAFEVAESTVLRWADGSARPHPRIQGAVVSFLGSHVPGIAVRTEPIAELREENARLRRLLQRKVELTFGSFHRGRDGMIELPVQRDAAGVVADLFEMMGRLLEGTFRGGSHAKNYLMMKGSSAVCGPIEVIVQRVGKLSPHDARKEAEAHLARAVALLAEHGIAWDGPTTFQPDEPQAIAEPPSEERSHAEWCRIDIDQQPNVLRCLRCGAEQAFPSEVTARAFQALGSAFGESHADCKEGDAEMDDPILTTLGNRGT